MAMLPASTSLPSACAASLAGSTSAMSAYTTNQRSTTRIVASAALTSCTLMMYGAVTELRTSSSSFWSEPATSRNRGALDVRGLAVAEPRLGQLDRRPVRLQALLEDPDIDRIPGMPRLDPGRLISPSPIATITIALATQNMRSPSLSVSPDLSVIAILRPSLPAAGR